MHGAINCASVIASHWRISPAPKQPTAANLRLQDHVKEFPQMTQSRQATASRGNIEDTTVAV
jgi:hypothetical protein